VRGRGQYHDILVCIYIHKSVTQGHTSAAPLRRLASLTSPWKIEDTLTLNM